MLAVGVISGTGRAVWNTRLYNVRQENNLPLLIIYLLSGSIRSKLPDHHRNSSEMGNIAMHII